jgi:hypothetical protein
MTHRHLPLFVILVVLSVPASADIVFSNFGPDNSYDPSVGLTIESSPFEFAESAMGFTPSGDFTLTQIDVGITYVFGTNSVMLSLNSDSSGLPDGVIESWTLTGLPPFGPTSNIVQTVMPVSPVSLLSGTQYWLVASPIASDTGSAWNINSIGSTGPFTQNFGSGFETPGIGAQGAFAVLGVPVPEPNPTSLLLATVLLACLGVALRRRVRPTR